MSLDYVIRCDQCDENHEISSDYPHYVEDRTLRDGWVKEVPIEGLTSPQDCAHYCPQCKGSIIK